MTDVGTGHDEPPPLLMRNPAAIVVKIFVNGKTVGEVVGERPSEVEARAFCRELQPAIEALVREGRGLVQ